MWVSLGTKEATKDNKKMAKLQGKNTNQEILSYYQWEKSGMEKRGKNT